MRRLPTFQQKARCFALESMIKVVELAPDRVCLAMVGSFLSAQPVSVELAKPLCFFLDRVSGSLCIMPEP